MRIGKALLAIAGATMLLGALASAASARNLSASNQTLRVAFREIRFSGVFGNINCTVTVEGSFHQRTQAKVAGSLVGYITRADLGPCSAGVGTVLRETLPWHIRYASFTGALPNITAFRANAIGVSFRVTEPFATCLARSTAESPAVVTFNRDTVTQALTTAELGGSLPTSCGANGTFTSTRDNVTVLNSATRITLTLI
jgi:hypothetical protein